MTVYDLTEKVWNFIYISIGLVLGEGVRQERLIFLSSCSRARKFAIEVKIQK